MKIIKLGKDYFWLCVVAIIKPKDKDILLHIHISAAERNMFIAEHFLRSLVKKVRKIPSFSLPKQNNINYI